MPSNNFIKALKFSLIWEVGIDKKTKELREDGGYTDDPTDRGGATKWGISEKAHPELAPIIDLTFEKACDVYYKEYWRVYQDFKALPLDLDSVLLDLAVVIFDTGVNLGPRRSYSFWKQAVDQKAKDPAKVVLGLRDKYYFDLVTLHADQKKYYNGWVNRMNDLKKYVDIIRVDPEA